ncbi:hypothetical protein HJFPF1_05736 [Paramyrothecium foliicola]|nr:hypothetical protein HJFPF1_05736 [Paramyrothecium foliicola]
MENQETPPDENSSRKVRVLLETYTHLVPGMDRGEKLAFIKNIVCQHYWKRDMDYEQERWYPYRDDFGLENVHCFFLIDHHGHDHTVEEETVPVEWYRWTGETLVRVHRDFPSKIQRELRKWPFTWEGRKFHRSPKGPDGNYDPTQRREIIMSSLRLGAPIRNDEVQFLKEYPDHAQWLKAHLKRELWAKIEPFCDISEKEK